MDTKRCDTDARGRIASASARLPATIITTPRLCIVYTLGRQSRRDLYTHSSRLYFSACAQQGGVAGPTRDKMFTSKAKLERKTGKRGMGRFQYLQALVTEFQDTSKHDFKLQVLANLANFAYDPVNYDFFRQLNILDLFLGK